MKISNFSWSFFLLFSNTWYGLGIYSMSFGIKAKLQNFGTSCKRALAALTKPPVVSISFAH